ncbi:MAG: beta-ketoacyl synthase N-terminal-like domain-containing protein [Paludibacteraceae bacterium]
METIYKQPVYWVADHIISALGVGTDLNVERILAYETGITTQVDADVCASPFTTARINWNQILEADGFTRLERLMLTAIDHVVQQVPSLNIADDTVGIVFSTTKGNIDLLVANEVPDERVFLPTMAKRVASKCGFTSEPIVVSNACISGISSLIVAARLIERRIYRHIVVVGGDLLTDFVVSGFRSFKSVSGVVCRPYDVSRDGLSMGEACGAVLLTADETLASIPTVCIAGGAVTNDANHISGPSRTGDGLHYAIRAAMAEAQVSKHDLAFVSAHGTATVYNDEMESKSLALSDLSDILVNSVKPYFGHTLGACGVIESILAVWQLRHRIVFGTKGFAELGVPMPMTVAAEHQPIVQGSACLKIASGFGGCNAALVLTRDCAPIACLPDNDYICSLKTVTLSGTDDFAVRIRDEYRALHAPNLKFFKMDDQCKLGYVCVEKLLADVDLPTDATRTAVIVSNRSASLDTDLKHQSLLDMGDAVSPAVFVYTLPNIVSGEICIRHHIQGENTFFVQSEPGGFALCYAELLLHWRLVDYVIFGWCDRLRDRYEATFQLLARQGENF